jgi:hypothetical protein
MKIPAVVRIRRVRIPLAEGGKVSQAMKISLGSRSIKLEVESEKGKG